MAIHKFTRVSAMAGRGKEWRGDHQHQRGGERSKARESKRQSHQGKYIRFSMEFERNASILLVSCFRLGMQLQRLKVGLDHPNTRTAEPRRRSLFVSSATTDLVRQSQLIESQVYGFKIQ